MALSPGFNNTGDVAAGSATGRVSISPMPIESKNVTQENYLNFTMVLLIGHNNFYLNFTKQK